MDHADPKPGFLGIAQSALLKRWNGTRKQARLRCNAAEYDALCTAANANVHLLVEGHVWMSGPERIDWTLAQTGSRPWRAESPRFPLRRYCDNSPGRFRSAVDFVFDYRVAKGHRIFLGRDVSSISWESGL